MCSLFSVQVQTEARPWHRGGLKEDKTKQDTNQLLQMYNALQKRYEKEIKTNKEQSNAIVNLHDFFDEIEDLKYALQESSKLNKAYDNCLKQICVKYGLSFPDALPTYCRNMEWQMERAFQTAMWFLRPEIVFILGDIFDEGKWSSPKNWEDDVRRFRQMFRHPDDTELVVVAGNHDIGFHYEMDLFRLQRFEKVFNVTSARVVTKKGVNFVLVNSVALHGDGCYICQMVEKELIKISHALNCSIQSSSPMLAGALTRSIETGQCLFSAMAYLVKPLATLSPCC
ncbi:Metallophosphoesterase 1 [Acipenser ruthenus]|uniref:Metallophosphoesterase 1 n=1 Tax=Acipenser ruthenus TaxID=7906 RepID=A0A444TZD1_ACIRT|nr:Metallophosphoesterase 1 [Acipenser ruthenus]